MGPSGNGLVERMKAGESPWDQGLSVQGAPVRSFPEGGPEDEGKRRSGAPVREAISLHLGPTLRNGGRLL